MKAKIRFQWLVIAVVFSLCAVPEAKAVLYETETSKISTEDAGAVEPGAAEVEFGYGFMTGRKAFDRGGKQIARGSMREHAFDWKVAFGVIPRVELNATIGYSDIGDKDYDPDWEDPEEGEIAEGHRGPTKGQGWRELEIGSKIELIKNTVHDFILSYMPSIAIPSGRESHEDRLAPGSENATFGQRLVASKNWGKWNVNVDTGYGLPFGGSREGGRGTWDTNAAVGYHVLPWLEPEFEVNYAHGFKTSMGDSDSLALTAGFVMPLHERFRLNSGVQQVVAGNNTDKTTSVIVAATFFI